MSGKSLEKVEKNLPRKVRKLLQENREFSKKVNKISRDFF